MQFQSILQFLHSLPFWPRTRTHYFTQGIADGKAAASLSRTPLPANSTYVAEQALVAAAALPGRVAPDDAWNYRSGWVEGYRTMGKQAGSSAAQ
ncbi:MAG: hypothetical protein ACXWQR_18400 [Ktedonobacterales bacterium]